MPDEEKDKKINEKNNLYEDFSSKINPNTQDIFFTRFISSVINLCSSVGNYIANKYHSRNKGKSNGNGMTR